MVLAGCRGSSRRDSGGGRSTWIVFHLHISALSLDLCRLRAEVCKTALNSVKSPASCSGRLPYDKVAVDWQPTALAATLAWAEPNRHSARLHWRVARQSRGQRFLGGFVCSLLFCLDSHVCTPPALAGCSRLAGIGGAGPRFELGASLPPPPPTTYPSAAANRGDDDDSRRPGTRHGSLKRPPDVAERFGA